MLNTFWLVCGSILWILRITLCEQELGDIGDELGDIGEYDINKNICATESVVKELFMDV